MELLSAVVVYLLRLIGVVLIYAALFTYEDEEDRFQDRIQTWWIRLHDKQKTARSRVAAFMQEVARLTGEGLDQLFGKRLLSLHFVIVSVYLSIASFFLLILVIWSRLPNTGTATRREAFFWLLFFVALALGPALIKSRLWRAVWWAVIPIVLARISGFLFFVYKRYGAVPLLRGIGIALVPFAASLVCDAAYILLTRWILRRVSGIDRVYEILFMFMGNLVALVIPVFFPIYAAVAIGKYAPRAGAFIAFSLLFNFIDFVAGFAAALLAFLLLVHRLFWPIIHRPLYAIHRFAPIKNKAFLFGTGVTLLFVPTHINLENIKSLLQKHS
jgi:hypothetical protein